MASTMVSRPDGDAHVRRSTACSWILTILVSSFTVIACTSSELPRCNDRVDIAFTDASGERLFETRGHVRLQDGTEFDFTCPKQAIATVTYYCIDHKLRLIGVTPESLSIFVQTADGRLGADVEMGLDYRPTNYQDCVEAELTLELR